MGLQRSHLRAPGPPDPAPPRLAALLDPLPEALPQATLAAHVAPGPGALTGGLSRQLCDRHSPGREGGPPAWGITATCVASSLPPSPLLGFTFLCAMGTRHDRLPRDNQGLDPTRLQRPVRLQKEALGPRGASWAGGGGAGECWLGGAAASGTTTGSGPGLPCPPCSGLPSSLTQESLVFAGS